MKQLWAALTATGLILMPAGAQNEHPGDKPPPGHPHQNPPAPPPPPPHMGGPNRWEATPGNTPKTRPDLRMNGKGEIEHANPNRHAHDFERGGPIRRDDFRRGWERRDFGDVRGDFNAERRFHAGPWRPPQDYRYRHWRHGERLPSLYFDPGLWITSFGLYGLMAPPPDTVWVRSGPDALLVDRYTGEIIRVQYGVFY